MSFAVDFVALVAVLDVEDFAAVLGAVLTVVALVVVLLTPLTTGSSFAALRELFRAVTAPVAAFFGGIVKVRLVEASQ